MNTFYLVQGDDAPQVKVALTRDVTGDVISLAARTAVLKFRKKGSTTILGTLADVASADKNEQGIAIFQWGFTDLDIDEGLYEAEIEITDDETGRVETVYETLQFKVREDF